MINYANETIHFNSCLGCAYANHEFSLPCGMAFENDRFTLSQDWELPIQGFFVVSPKRCVEKLCDLSIDERNEMFDIVNKTIEILRENNFCDRFDVIFEEKEKRHFHVWIMPRHKWMEDLVGDIIEHIGEISNYAKANLKNEESFKSINKITEIVRESFKEKKQNFIGGNFMNNKNYIGKTINVKIDRPLGSKHPKHGFIYPVNYGYIPGTISGDGEELDCYVLGVFEPLDTFTGKCIAIIHRTNDDDDKLIIVPEEKEYSNDAIDALVEFQEKYFEHIIIR